MRNGMAGSVVMAPSAKHVATGERVTLQVARALCRAEVDRIGRARQRCYRRREMVKKWPG